MVRRTRWWWLVLFLAPFGGCGSQPGGGALTQDERNLQILARLLGMYSGEHQGRGPASEQEFFDWLRNMPEAERKRFDVTDVDKQFTSTRDQQPFQIVPNRGGQGVPMQVPKVGTGGGLPSIDMVAYEKEGKDGFRLAVDVVGAVYRLEESAFQEALTKAKSTTAQ